MRANLYLVVIGFLFWFAIAVILVFSGRVLKRLGIRRRWSFLLAVPVVNICAFWVLALAAWPSDSSVYRPTWQTMGLGLVLTALSFVASSLIGEMQLFGKIRLLETQQLGTLLMLPSCCVLERVGLHKAWSLLHLIPLGSVVALFLLAYLPWPSDLLVGHAASR